MAKVLATISFQYEMDESDTLDETPIEDQIQTDMDEIREMVIKYGKDIKVEFHNVDTVAHII